MSSVAITLPARPTPRRYFASLLSVITDLRAGDMLQAGFVVAGTWLAFTTRQYAWVNMALVAVWLVLVAGIYREHRKMVKS